MKNILNILGAGLSFTAACMGVIDKYGWRKGWFISAAVLAVVVLLSIVLKIFLKEDTKKEEQDADQIIGDEVIAEEKITFEDIGQKASGQHPRAKQSVGKAAKSNKGISFNKIRQEKK
jgi:hypothetical protein